MSYARDIERLQLLQSTLKKARENEEAQVLLSDVGYATESFDRAQDLHDAAWRLIEAQTQAEIAYDTACKTLEAAEKKVDEAYAIDRALARSAFLHNEIMLEHLGLMGKQDPTVQGRHEHARKLYTTKLEEPNAKLLTDGGLAATRRAARMAQVHEEQDARTAMETALAYQTKATDDRDAAIKQALAWLTTFRTVARKVFKGKQHLLDLFEL